MSPHMIYFFYLNAHSFRTWAEIYLDGPMYYLDSFDNSYVVRDLRELIRYPE
jgi:hypothetical protein